jgi:hypothetical protein
MPSPKSHCSDEMAPSPAVEPELKMAVAGKQTLGAPTENSTTGFLYTVRVLELVAVWLPSVTTRVMVYVCSFVKIAEGFLRLELLPFPKFQE